MVATGAGRCLAVLTADCASVALGTPEGYYGAVHAGWRGLEAGVVEEAVEVLYDLGGSQVMAGIGPCIHPCCYEFSSDDLEVLAARYGETVRSTTRDSRRALDLPAAVRGALEVAGATLVVDSDICTGCTPGWFSHRARGDLARQALLVWAEGQ
jgi:copper oxidase (laccase) domain-containing protein